MPLTIQSHIVKILDKDFKEIERAGPEDEEVWVITRETPFFGACGGQVGDTGWIYEVKEKP